MNEKQCLTANWQDLGFYDGNQGKALSLFDERAGDCAKHGIIADRQTYLTAREKGLLTYCTKEKGYEVGYRGKRYLGVCHGAAAEKFLSGYNRGKRIYDQKKVVNKLKNKLQALENDIRREYNEQIRIEENLIREDDSDERVYLTEKLMQIQDKISQLRLEKDDVNYNYQIELLQLNRLL